MAAINHFVVPHQCDFCRKIVIGYSQEEKNADRTTVLSHGEQVLRKLLLDLDRHEDLSRLRSEVRRENIMLFDLSLEEVKVAAAEGCALCAWLFKHIVEVDELIYRSEKRVPKDGLRSFTLGAKVYGRDVLHFGVPMARPRRSTPSRWANDDMEAYIDMNDAGIPRCQMAALRRKLKKLSC